ncbi:MAG TPA: UDP-N-acetylglucosamine 2-epimerase (non-hydrolyzing) [Arenicellales bacterium]|nr:UDP-N-acetylglucosamine 2-epimerase (non-hydrolyzing) [Arenicellales bacterium]
MIQVTVVAGARPNFMKVAPLIEALGRRPDIFRTRLVHTGQHYDEAMSRSFFEALGLPRPDVDLEVGSGSHAEQTGRVMIEFEKVLLNDLPDLVVVVGDVNSTLACAVTARKLGVPVAHVEAGLRSRDMEMPEEINRLCTDVLCDYLFTTDEMASDNLRREGVDESKIHFVGNVMIDTLLKHRDMAAREPILDDLGLQPGHYVLTTLHRPSNVDDPAILKGLVEVLLDLSSRLPVVFPVHPRTRDRIRYAGLLSTLEAADRLILLDPLGYLPFLNLIMHAGMVLTDSGGLQEETTVLGVPCLTLRHNTERPITCSQGTNRLVGNQPPAIRSAIDEILQGSRLAGAVPEKWDGRAAERIVEVLAGRLPG